MKSIQRLFTKACVLSPHAPEIAYSGHQTIVTLIPKTSLVRESSFTHIKILLFCIHVSLWTFLTNTAPPYLSGCISSLTDNI